MSDTHKTFVEFDMPRGAVDLMISFTRTTAYDSEGLDFDDASDIVITWPSGATTPLYRIFRAELRAAVLAKVEDYIKTHAPEPPETPERDWDAERDSRRDDPDFWRD